MAYDAAMLEQLKGAVRTRLPLPVRRTYRRWRFFYDPPPWYLLRVDLARRHLSGQGLEIGALHMPTRLPRGASARYVDVIPNRAQRTRRPNLIDWPLVRVDILDDGETLRSVPDQSVDFVIAHHMIEHTQNPIGTLVSWLRVTRQGGTLMLGVPHREKTFDRRRAGTTVEHVVRDYQEGPGWSRDEHYLEYATLVEEAEDPAAHAEQLRAQGARIHFHTWTASEFTAMVEACHSALGLPLDLLEVDEVADTNEFVVVLRRT